MVNVMITIELLKTEINAFDVSSRCTVIKVRQNVVFSSSSVLFKKQKPLIFSILINQSWQQLTNQLS